MKVDLFDFDLPRANIASRPAVPRDSAKLLRVCPAAFEDHIVRDLPDLLQPGDLLVCNDTKVIPARLRGRRGTTGIAVTLHMAESDTQWRAFARPAKKLQAGDRIVFAEDFAATVSAKGLEGEVTLVFDHGGSPLLDALDRYGEMPLPPYIKREQGADDQDRSDYQTMFAAAPGAVAAPTAGLHFTPDLVRRLEARAIRRASVTLHVGAGTFLPVKADDTVDHRMHAEWGSIRPDVAEQINRVKAEGGRIVAVGSTSLRLLESASDALGRVQAYAAPTDIFITPGYRFRVADLMMTNFHLPRSTLFMLVAAFAGLERMHNAYTHAIGQGYRFYSYGDASLLEREGA